MTTGFAATCLPLEEILRQAGHKRVDFLSVDAEGAEIEVFRNFPWDEFDVRLIIVEVSSPARYVPIDQMLLENGFGKVGVLGGDFVYAKTFLPKFQWPVGAGEHFDELQKDRYFVNEVFRPKTGKELVTEL